MKKITLAASAAVLSATVLASNAFAMNCSEMTGNQLLAAIERGQCEVLLAGSTHSIIENDKFIRTTKGDRPAGAAGKSGGYGY